MNNDIIFIFSISVIVILIAVLIDGVKTRKFIKDTERKKLINDRLEKIMIIDRIENINYSIQDLSSTSIRKVHKIDMYSYVRGSEETEDYIRRMCKNKGYDPNIFFENDFIKDSDINKQEEINNEIG